MAIDPRKQNRLTIRGKQAAHFVTSLSFAGIYVTAVFIGNLKFFLKEERQLLRIILLFLKKAQSPLLVSLYLWIGVRALIISLAGLIPLAATGFMSI